jgi:MFS family permease
MCPGFVLKRTFMFRQWLALVVIVLVYIPVAIDATVLHVAAPTLSMTLAASGNELLWIIDIYSLVMAGMVLPMGALGDRIGFKRAVWSLFAGGGIFQLRRRVDCGACQSGDRCSDDHSGDPRRDPHPLY